MTTRVLVVDDEPLARQRLLRLLGNLEHYTAIGEAENGEEALHKIAETHPDIVLLDIRMPEVDGLQIAERINQLDTPPAIVFCTAYDDYAIAAFQVNAVGYILKPVRQEALQNALDKSARLNKTQLNALEQNKQTEDAQYLVAKTYKGTELIELTHIYYFMADQKYVTVYHQGGETIIDDTLKDLERTYANYFLRVHRNALVNQNRIHALNRNAQGHYELKLDGVSTPLSVSRRHAQELKQWLQQR